MSGPPPEIPIPPLSLASNPRGAGLFAICIVLMILATVAVVMRLWARKYKGVNLAADDYIIILALIALYANGISECVAVTLGGRGLHQVLLPPELQEINFQDTLRCPISMDLFDDTDKSLSALVIRKSLPVESFAILTYTLMAVVIAYCVGCVVFFAANCQPFLATFTPWMSGAHCGNNEAGWLGTGIANIITDIAILSLPMKNVWDLQMPTRTKWAVCGIFGLGFMTVIISIIRLITLFQVDISDFTYSAVPADILSAFEPTLMIACTCIPIMRPLFKRFFPTNTDRYYGRDDTVHVLSGKHTKPVDISLSGIKKSGTTVKHKSLHASISDRFRRGDHNDVDNVGDDDSERALKTIDSDPSSCYGGDSTSRFKTPSPSRPLPAPRDQSKVRHGIEVKTDILVVRE